MLDIIATSGISTSGISMSGIAMSGISMSGIAMSGIAIIHNPQKFVGNHHADKNGDKKVGI